MAISVLGGVRELAAALLVAAALPGGSGEAAELVMFSERGCSFCARFEAEIGPIYPKTAEARRAPLRRVDLGEGIPAELAHLRPPSFTPTFVLLDGEREIGRIQGYPGEMHFWGLLGMLLERLGEEPVPRPVGG